MSAEKHALAARTTVTWAICVGAAGAAPGSAAIAAPPALAAKASTPAAINLTAASLSGTFIAGSRSREV
jgi:hypothetical protein